MPFVMMASFTFLPTSSDLIFKFGLRKIRLVKDAVQREWVLFTAASLPELIYDPFLCTNLLLEAKYLPAVPNIRLAQRVDQV